MARPVSDLVSRRAHSSEAPVIAELAARTFADAFGPRNDPSDIAACFEVVGSHDLMLGSARQTDLLLSRSL